MASVQFLGPTSRADGTEIVEVDDLTLHKGGEAVKLSDDQVERVRALSGLRFRVDGVDELEALTVDELRERAQEANIDGAAEMKKAELVKALGGGQ